ncbi:class I SAM-dependent DNA methyltransferase [Hymenobacter sp. IS2118]|uniref:HsdM family class I SAM-dependent methyltransferase n=1 Tax=Hymenobacter sp. IS2118 TaxID=1505605 RepID=UPI00068F1318|nr:N-6 DNA methylase [Hymenobacter sp. IS2118]
MTTYLSVVDQLGFKDGLIDRRSDRANLTALQRHYLKQADRFSADATGADGVDKIYFSGEQPAIYFKAVTDFLPETVKTVVRLQRKVWNQGKVPFLYVESPTEVRVYNCYETPKSPTDTQAEKELQLFHASVEAQAALQELYEVFGKIAIESGAFWEEEKYAKQVQSKTRVNEQLAANLKTTRQLLRVAGLDVSIIHDLLLRSLFILYLEDRKATTPEFYRQYHPTADSYFKVLTDKNATYALFEKLETVFNGNLCPVAPNEREMVTPEHLTALRACFYTELPTAQQVLFPDWRIFDFEVIPIQLISEIYEDFLRQEDGAEHMKEIGAFYTPHALAEFVLNEVLPYPSSGNARYDIRTLDPTCGSGIFLVDTLNRLLDRWEFTHPSKTLSFDTVQQLVLDNIFGIEIKAEAIKVAAFSIYLAMLDRLNPKTLWHEVHFPYLIYRPGNTDSKRQGQNLFLMSSLEAGPFEELTFDLVVGNPPFTNKPSADVKAYLKPLKFASEMVLAFLHRATVLCPDGQIALIATSKILFNNHSTSKNFRRFLFNDTYVEKVYNFSALRRVAKKTGGRNLFASAQRPVCVLVYRKQQPTAVSSHLVYYTPTTTVKNRLIDGIAIDPIDVKHLPRTECQNPATNIWKIAMWGTERDFRLIEQLTRRPSLDTYLTREGYVKAVGFETSRTKAKNKHPSDILASMPFIDAQGLDRYYTPKSYTADNARDKVTGLPITKVMWPITKPALYRSPHLLVKEGQSDKNFCASYLDYDCSFRRTIYGISAPGKDEDLKLLTAYLNSSFAAYLMFLTASDWGVERERVSPGEMLNIPSLCFDLPTATKERIVALVDEIIGLRKHLLKPTIELNRAEQAIETLLRDGLNLSATDRLLIDSVLKYRLGAFRDRSKSDAFAPSVEAERCDYAALLCQTINQFLQAEDLQASAAYFTLAPKTPLQVVALYLDGRPATAPVTELPAADLGELLRRIEAHTYHEKAESIYYRRFIKYYVADTVYLVKPNEKRFWSPASALNDADEVIAEILAEMA